MLDLAERVAWRPVLERMAAAVATALRGVSGTERGRQPLAIGAGGDRTTVVDRVAEDAVVAVCEAVAAEGRRFLLRSEELGERRFGADSPVVLLDPVDGSRNAMQGVPYFSTSIALLDGPTLGDVAAGVVRNLAGSGCYAAVRGAGVERDGSPLVPLAVGLGPRGRIPMLLIEAHRSAGDDGDADPRLGALLAEVVRVRMLGSAALSLCQVASGAASALVAPTGMRPYDCAAGLAILAEVGAVVTDLEGAPIGGVPADFGRRTALVASNDPAVHRRVLHLLAGR